MISVRQLKAARSLVGWSQAELAAQSGVSRPTIARLEMADEQVGGYAATRDKLARAFETAGISFLSEADGSEGVMIRSK